MKVKTILDEINQEIKKMSKTGVVKTLIVKSIVNKRLNIHEGNYKRPVSYSGINQGYGLRVTYNSKFILIDGNRTKTITGVTLNIFGEAKCILEDIKELSLSQFTEFIFLIAPRGIYYPASLDKYIALAKKV